MQNILETQVSDITNLTDSPISIAAGYEMNGQQRPTSSSESPPKDNKRKNTDGQPAAPQQRAKRNRYISIACNECKRRKIKCNGNTPCQRCGNLNLECQYSPNCCANGFKDSEEFKRMNAQIASLQEQVNSLYAGLNSLRNGEASSLAPSERSMPMGPPLIHNDAQNLSMRPPAKVPRYQGPTTSAFNIDVGKNTLHSMGLPVPDGVEGGNMQEEDDNTPIPPSPPRSSLPLSPNTPLDPLWTISKDEAIRLCRVYEEEMGIMYPVVDIEVVIRHAANLYRFLDAAKRNGLASEAYPAPKGIKDDMSITLKMVVACALVTEGGGQSHTATRLYESVREIVDGLLHAVEFQIKDIPVLVLVTIYHFQMDQEVLAWRLIGQVVRMCIELGLHRRDSLFRTVPNEEERASVIKMFWAIYSLDRRWSFGTGLPFAVQDSDIDPTLPEPVLAIPYLNVMISYSRISSRVWRSVAGFENNSPLDIKKDEMGYLDFQILQWQKSIPAELQLPTANSPRTTTRAIHRLQILLYLRANQMRILIYRPILHSANSIVENMSYAQIVVEVAKDTIRALTHLNQTTDIYRVQQNTFNYFLISALAVLFLASCHGPVQFSSVCRDEFYMALDLVKGFSSRSYVSKRLWRTIKSLKEIAPNLGLSEDIPTNNMEDPHSSAALAMAGLAGHEISGMGTFGMSGAPDRNGIISNSPINGYQMSHEMTNLFEAALGGMNGLNGTGSGYVGNGMQDGQGDGLVGVNTPMGLANQEELYRQLRDLF